MPKSSKAFFFFLNVLSLLNHPAGGLVLIRDGVDLMLCIGINSSASIILFIPYNGFVRQALSFLHYFLYHK